MRIENSRLFTILTLENITARRFWPIFKPVLTPSRLCQEEVEVNAIIDKGIMWTGIEKILVQCIGLAQGIILARLLSPEDFGFAGMLWLFVGVASVLAESGLGAAHIVFGGNSRQVFLWNVGLGVVMYVLLACGAPAIAAFYGHPILKPLVRVMALGALLGSICVLGNARLQRERQFSLLSIVNIVTTLFGFSVAVVLALAGYGVWAIAWTGVAAMLLRVVLFAANKVLLPINSDSAGDFRHMLSYGLKLTGSSLVQSAYQNIYTMVLGKMFAPATVGLFSRAQRWASLPVEAVNESVARVALLDIVENKMSARRCIAINAFVLWPALIVLWVLAEQIVGFVFGSAWLDCVPYMRILLIGVAVSPFGSVARQYIRAKGRSGIILRNDLVKKPAQLGLLIVGAYLLTSHGIKEGVASLCWVKVASDMLDAGIDFFAAWRLRIRTEALCFNKVRFLGTSLGTQLEKMHEERRMDAILAGKSIAVVGNGPSERGRGLGGEIDAHDIVIRINNYRTNGYERDYGRRTDVWMKCGAADIGHEIRDFGIKAVLYTEDLVNVGMIAQFVRFPEEELKRGIIVDYIDEADHAALANEIGAVPSSGAFLIDRLRRIPDVKVDVYGFSFLEDSSTLNTAAFVHYAKDTPPEYEVNISAGAKHDVSKEVIWFSSHFYGRRLK